MKQIWQHWLNMTAFAVTVALASYAALYTSGAIQYAAIAIAVGTGSLSLMSFFEAQNRIQRRWGARPIYDGGAMERTVKTLASAVKFVVVGQDDTAPDPAPAILRIPIELDGRRVYVEMQQVDFYNLLDWAANRQRMGVKGLSYRKLKTRWAFSRDKAAAVKTALMSTGSLINYTGTRPGELAGCELADVEDIFRRVVDKFGV